MDTLPDLGPLAQPRILAAPESPALFLTLGLRGEVDVAVALRRLASAVDPSRTVLGLGAPLVRALEAEVPGLRGFTPVIGKGVSYPATQGALWLALYGGDDGMLLHEARRLLAALGPGFAVDDEISAYQHRDGRDLSGYLDGTANPTGLEAELTALVEGEPGLAGGSFVHTQRWVHDLGAYDGLSGEERDAVIGRRSSDNEEIAEAPDSAHVKRTAQEDVGFLLRRSMPWGSVGRCGLVFVAYAADPDVFLRHLERMSGAADGVVDALNRISHPVTGGLYWCPPMSGARLDLRAVGL